MGINFNGIGDYQPASKALRNTGNIGKTENLQKTPINMKIETQSTEFKRTDFGTDAAALTGKVQTLSPEGQGFPSAAEVRNGKLGSGYYFNNLGQINEETFDRTYSSANVPQIANGTKGACDDVEYAQVAGHLQTNQNPYAELFT